MIVATDALRYDFPLFVPADRPERYEKALAAAHDAVIIDLEDAVGIDDKRSARDVLANHAVEFAGRSKTLFVRVNARNTQWHADDLALCESLSIDGVVLPKSESADDLLALRSALPDHMLRLALVETTAGLLAAASIAVAASRLVFGSVDFCADLGCDHDQMALLRPRQDLVIASRMAGLPAPVDGVTTALKDIQRVRDDAAHAAMLGFGGKLLIHPAQIATAREGFAPAPDVIAWAQQVLSASVGQAVAVDGMMIDAPVLMRARSILARGAKNEEGRNNGKSG